MYKYKGLSTKEVEYRIKEGKINKTSNFVEKTRKQILLANIFTFFNMIFFIIALSLIIVKSFNHIMFMPVIIINIIIGIVQELRAKSILDKLTLINQQKITVYRNSEEVKLSIEELVIDDIILLESGIQIPADAEVLDGEIFTNESLLTGESDEIKKNSGDQLLSGSFVVSGNCIAKLTKVGDESYAGYVTNSARKLKKSNLSEMMKSLNFLIKIIGISMIPIGSMLFYRHYIKLGLDLKGNITATSAALLGMIPEGLFLLVSVALALSVIRLSKKKVLVRKLSCIEALARVDLFCVDKTGTITDDIMTVNDIIPFKETDLNEMLSDLSDFSNAMTDDNNTIKAMKIYFSKDLKRDTKQILSFSSKFKFSGVTFSDNNSFVFGAPEVLLKEDYPKYSKEIEILSNKGFRVLLFGKTSEELKYGCIPEKVIPKAYVTLSNHVRDGAVDTFNFFESQNVSIRVISGDNPTTVSSVAIKAGIKNAEKYIDARLLDTPEKISEAVNKYTVFGRVTPEQKRDIICAMKTNGHTVAMTGDGVNDVLALKEADCSVAMASGADVAQKVSDLVLLNSDFSSMPSIVNEGRRVINNIERSASLFLVKNIFTFLLALISIIAVFKYPLTPAQLTLFNTFMIGIPSFVLALEPNTSRVTGKFLFNVLYSASVAAISDLIIVTGLMWFSSTFYDVSGQLSTIAIILMGGVGIQFLIKICRPFNLLRIILVSGVTIGFLVCVFFDKYLHFSYSSRTLFALEKLNFEGFIVLIIFILISIPIFIIVAYIEKKIIEHIPKEWLMKKAKNKK